MKSNRTRGFLILLILTALAACNSDYTTQKRRGYFRIELPQKAYQKFDQPGYPYLFEYPVYARIEKKGQFFGEKTENPYWINIVFPQFNGTFHISYKAIGKNNFDSLVNDAFNMAYKQHTSKANAIVPVPFTTPGGIEGVYFTLTGNTATANQFFATDSVNHFLRGALYFDATPNEDSLRPVNNFLRQDMQHLINTLRWR